MAIVKMLVDNRKKIQTMHPYFNLLPIFDNVFYGTACGLYPHHRFRDSIFVVLQVFSIVGNNFPPNRPQRYCSTTTEL